jgi:predicted aspartyl protease
MTDEAGAFRTTLGVAAIADPTYRRELTKVVVDSGSEYSWIPDSVLAEIGIVPVRIEQFENADGCVFERHVGFAILDVDGSTSPTIVVFARDSDTVLLGSHGLDGMNLRIDRVKMELVPAGPIPAAAAA